MRRAKALPKAARLINAMPEPDLISGPWMGYYSYARRPQRHRMLLGLRFGRGRIVGEGKDDIGHFVIRGQYDLPTRECWWSKGYVGLHEVHYSGLRVGKAIQGTWSVAKLTGLFRIWPLGHGGDDETAAKSNAKPADAKLVGVGR